HLLKVSRLLVIIWGVVLAFMAWQFSGSNLDLVTLAFSMTTYTWGPMLGLLVLSICVSRYHVVGIGKSVLASIVVVLLINEPEILNPVLGTTFTSPVVAWPWLFPIGCLTCVTLSLRGRKVVGT
ncbi:uncharacterized protein METZ01_LOCUS457928, partial [marine metagenome]